MPVKLPELVDPILSQSVTKHIVRLRTLNLLCIQSIELRLANEGHVNSIWKWSLLCVGNRAKCLTRPDTTNQFGFKLWTRQFEMNGVVECVVQTGLNCNAWSFLFRFYRILMDFFLTCWTKNYQRSQSLDTSHVVVDM